MSTTTRAARVVPYVHGPTPYGKVFTGLSQTPESEARDHWIFGSDSSSLASLVPGGTVLQEASPAPTYSSPAGMTITKASSLDTGWFWGTAGTLFTIARTQPNRVFAGNFTASGTASKGTGWRTDTTDPAGDANPNTANLNLGNVLNSVSTPPPPNDMPDLNDIVMFALSVEEGANGVARFWHSKTGVDGTNQWENPDVNLVLEDGDAPTVMVGPGRHTGPAVATGNHFLLEVIFIPRLMSFVEIQAVFDNSVERMAAVGYNESGGVFTLA